MVVDARNRTASKPPAGDHDPPTLTFEPLLVDAKSAARLLSIGLRQLWSLTACGAIPSRRIGRSVRYSPDELRVWISAGCPTAPKATGE